MNSVAITNETQFPGASESIRCFTAAQIAAALGRTRQAIAQRLAALTEYSLVIASGNAARSWKLSALPVDLQGELAAAAVRRGYADTVAMLASGQQSLSSLAWQHPRPAWREDSAAIEKAAKDRAVFQPFAVIKDSDPRTNAEKAAAGVNAYEHVHGHRIHPDYFLKKLREIIRRDSGLNDFDRLEIYLDADAGLKRNPRRQSAAALPAALADMVKTLDNPAAPTESDRKFLFDAAFRHLEENPAARDALIDSIFAAVPTLARTKKALLKQFSRKHAAWILAGGDPDALRDKRAINSGNVRKPDFSADEKKIRNEAILHDGSISLAYRNLRQTGQLSEAFVNHYHFNARRNKSYVPRKVRDSITNEVKMCGPIHHGPWKAKMSGPYIPRDWSSVQPGDWLNADDFTLNCYWSTVNASGETAIQRGETLVFIDLRTGYILDYVLIAGKYNSRHIRRLILRIHDRHGLPHAGFYFERGVWKARIIRDLDSRENVPWRETAGGLAQFNLHVRHATTPRAKTIEGLGRIWQERQRNEPGFVGFNERLDERERMQDFLSRARRGTVDPSRQLLTMEQWSARLDALFSEYNNDPQNGKMLQGASPAEAWQAGLERRPLRQLPDDARYLLSTHCTRVRVHQQGIILNIGGNKMLFANARTGQLVGQDVLAFYNLDCPDLLTVSDLKRQNYFTVKAISLPAMTATKEQFKEVHSAIGGHRRAAKEIYGSIQRPSAHTITRDNDVSEEAKELGRFVNAETEQHRHGQTESTRKLRKINSDAAALGLPLPSNVRNLDRVREGIELTANALERLERKEKENAEKL